MVEWCPKCGGMLTPGQEKCPSCGARLRSRKAIRRGADDAADLEPRDIFWLSAYMVGIALIPIILVVLIAMVCVLTMGR